MIAEILATGDEVLTGAVVDSNSAHISERLGGAGIAVTCHTCVGDDLDRLTEILMAIAGRSDIAVVTGGLGPTFDDLTSDAVAKAAGVELAFNAEADASIDRFFAARRFPRTASDRKQAMLPVGSTCLPNPVGSAPGFMLRIRRCLFFCLPGVPSEMRRMLDDEVLPRIETVSGKQGDIRRMKTLCLFGLPEAAVGERLAGCDGELPDVKIGLRATFPIIQVRLYADGRTEEIVREKIAAASDWVKSRLGSRVYSDDGETLEETVGRLLRERGSTLAVAESCTGGLLSHMVTNVPGSSSYFLSSVVAYSNPAKQAFLGVSAATLSAFGAVDEATVKEMAAGVRRMADATYGLATSGIAGPDGGTDQKPVGTICVGIATPAETRSMRLSLSFGSRSRNKLFFAVLALEMLRKELLALPPGL
ncbi:MAG: competence/damage-inducible protein A [Thermodesulfobacteriota bacterium]